MFHRATSKIKFGGGVVLTEIKFQGGAPEIKFQGVRSVNYIPEGGGAQFLCRLPLSLLF